MASDRWLPALAAVAALLLAAAPAPAQKVLVANLLYESPSLLAPTVFMASSAPDGRAWRAGVSGWTASGEWSRRSTPARTVVVAAWLTPLNANASDRLFVDGTRAPELAYGNATAAASIGLRIQPAPAWSSELRLIARYERVDGLPETTLHRWRKPFAGVEAVQVYQRITAEDPLRSHMEGLRVQARTEAFAGTRTWGRLTASVDAGHAAGPLLLRGHASYLLGHRLDTVSAFLVGGSWDAPGVHTLYGHPYAAFRIHDGLLLRGGADAPLGGQWRLGIRAARLLSPGEPASGAMLRLATSLSGIGAYAGIAAPGAAIRDGRLHDAFLILGLSAAVLPE